MVMAVVVTVDYMANHDFGVAIFSISVLCDSLQHPIKSTSHPAVDSKEPCRHTPKTAALVLDRTPKITSVQFAFLDGCISFTLPIFPPPCLYFQPVVVVKMTNAVPTHTHTYA